MDRYKHFGVMLDCSRDAVMKPREIMRMIDMLVKMGYNTLELYTEDTYEIDGEPYFGYMRGRYTGAELKEIDTYAKANGVELIPCIQTLAHFHTLVRHPAYRDIVDMGDVLLVGEEKTYALIDKMFASCAKNFTSRKINVGMDEAELIGLGKYLRKNGYHEPFKLLTKHLQRVVAIAEKYGFKPHMWSDMFFRVVNNGEYYGKDLHFFQEVVDSIPKNVELAYWDYYHFDKADYDEMLLAHKELGRETWFCGGAWSWCGFVPQYEKTLATMKPAMQSVREKGARNVLITMWGDAGKECSFFAMLPLLYTIRQYADGNFDEKIIKDGFYRLFHLQVDDFKMLSKSDGHDGFDLYTTSMHLYNDCFLGLNDVFVTQNGTVPYKEYAEQISKIAVRAGEFSYIFECISALCRVLELKYDFGVRIRRAYKTGERKRLEGFLTEFDELDNRIQIFYKSFQKLWHKENKPFGFEIHTLRIGGLMQRLKDCKARIQEYIQGGIDRIEELEEEPLPHPEYDAQYYTLISAGRI